MPTQSTETAETVTPPSVAPSWYDRNVVAGWYASLSMWLGLLGTLFPILLDGLQMALDNWPALSQALNLSPLQTIACQLAIAALIPPARAWRQKVMQSKALKQAALTGVISSQEGTAAVEVAVPGVEPIIIQPASPAP